MVKRFSAKRLLSMVMALAITVLSFPVGFNVLDGQTDPLVAAQGVRGVRLAHLEMCLIHSLSTRSQRKNVSAK